eukprot:CAMPEP_0196809720 /NCGR_PEP_ID=MMETSP1362-20130617/9614_1 /TAXON_ID=163516 /ORGANISM="Leptocylindrus danicus, Strain CCMP1856" /LENGTH=91 /DNA_ID=CAMNT_0042184485 /DNA_START=61 /DNA_END=335 /DNA_ORIENTATION=+
MTVKDETPAKEEPEIYVPVAEAVPAPAAAVPVAEAKPPHVNPSHNAPPATSSSSGARIQVPAAPTAVVKWAEATFYATMSQLPPKAYDQGQ